MKPLIRLFYISLFTSSVICSSVALRGFINGVLDSHPEGYILLFSIATFIMAVLSLGKIIPKNGRI